MNTRLTADERRTAVIDAATAEFALGGLAGTSTEAIARRAGVSQPYLFQLFGTKKGLFLAASRACFARTTDRFVESAREPAARGLDPEHKLMHMGHAYMAMLLADRSMLQLQLHSYAACHDPDVRAAVREELQRLWDAVAAASGASPLQVHLWFAEGMLINVIASIDDARTPEEFACSILGGGAWA